MVTLNNSSKRITIKTDKKVWEAGEDAFSVMMDNSRRAIYSKKDEWKEDLSLRVDVGVRRDFMHADRNMHVNARTIRPVLSNGMTKSLN